MQRTSTFTRSLQLAGMTGLHAIALLAQSSAANAAQETTFTGVVSDNMCGVSHMLKDRTAAECTRLGVKQGQKYALVVDQKVYTLNGHEAELDKLAGARAPVKGKVSGDTVAVESVTAAKS